MTPINQELILSRTDFKVMSLTAVLFIKVQRERCFLEGLTVIIRSFPDNIKENPIPPEIALVDFRVFNESIAPGKDSPLEKNIMTADYVVLNYWQNDISIDYVGLHYYRSSKNLYSFYLENYDNEWRGVKFQRTATYTNLDPGEYVFHVKAANSDGVWDEKGKQLKITILPPMVENFSRLCILCSLVWFRSIQRRPDTEKEAFNQRKNNNGIERS